MKNLQGGMAIINRIKKHPLLMGTMLLTCSGIISKIIGFFYKVFLSHAIGASGLGLYQLIFPIFMLCMAISTSGIQTSISRFVAQENAKGLSGRIYLALGLVISVTISSILMILIHIFAPWLAEHILMETRAQNLLKVMSYSLIPSCIHACFNGYYYGKRDSLVPSICQVMEQVFRVGGTYVMYLVLDQQRLPLLPIHAVWGLVISEIAGLLVSLTAFLWKSTAQDALPLNPKWNQIQELPFFSLLVMALPLTLNHLLLTLTHSLENLLIPQQLVTFGYSSEEALSHFGILSGMAMAVIMAPTALTGSLSVLLLPRISEAKTTGDNNRVSEIIKTAAGCGVTLGSLCTFLFLFSADWIGSVLFHTPIAGFYIQILSILCPFLYTNGLLNSIVVGLGHAGLGLICNLSGCLVRLIGIWFFMPEYGMYAYIITLVASFVLTTAELLWVVRTKCRN